MASSQYYTMTLPTNLDGDWKVAVYDPRNPGKALRELGVQDSEDICDRDNIRWYWRSPERKTLLIGITPEVELAGRVYSEIELCRMRVGGSKLHWHFVPNAEGDYTQTDFDRWMIFLEDLRGLWDARDWNILKLFRSYKGGRFDPMRLAWTEGLRSSPDAMWPYHSIVMEVEQVLGIRGEEGERVKSFQEPLKVEALYAAHSKG